MNFHAANLSQSEPLQLVSQLREIEEECGRLATMNAEFTQTISRNRRAIALLMQKHQRLAEALARSNQHRQETRKRRRTMP